MARLISSELATFLETGVSMIAGSRDARLRPETVRTVGVRVSREADEVTSFLPVATSARISLPAYRNLEAALAAWMSAMGL